MLALSLLWKAIIFNLFILKPATSDDNKSGVVKMKNNDKIDLGTSHAAK